MGTWGPGVFDNDGARDHLFDLMQGLADNITDSLAEATFAVSSDAELPLLKTTLASRLDIVLPNIEIICVLHETLKGGYLPPPSTVADWHANYEKFSMIAFSESELPSDRLEVVRLTFARMAEHCRACWDDEQMAA